MAEISQAFKPIKKRRLSDEVTAQIRAGIAAGDIVPGDKLPAERQMADSFAVSRGAVREALRNLELAGVVSMQHGVKGGAFVSNGNPDIMGDNLKDLLHLGGISLQELTEARVWIETIVTRIVCERATDEDIDALTANVDKAEAMFKQGRFDDKIDVNVEFHNILARATKNSMMAMLMSALMEVMRSISHEVGGETHDLTIRARRKFLKLLRNRDAEGAAKAMEIHVKQLQERYENIASAKSKNAGGLR
jgi:GntR family transcriptional regulator, transcriptional repressor for pyruvate dehydrogenase complex